MYGLRSSRIYLDKLSGQKHTIDAFDNGDQHVVQFDKQGRV